MFNLIPVFCSNDIMSLVRALPGSTAQGLIWGIMAIGVFLTFKILDFADLTVDGTFGTGGAVTVMLILAGYPPVVAVGIAFLAGMLAGIVTGILHTVFWYTSDTFRYIVTDCTIFSKLKYSPGKG